MKLKNAITSILLVFSLYVFGQEYGRTTVSNVYEVENVNADDLFKRINFAIANIYNSANDIIQLNDSESKILVIKALGDVFVPNQNKYIYPRKKYMQDDIAWKVNYTLNITARDGRYRMEINYGKINSEIGTYVNKIFSPYEALVKYTDEDIKKVISANQIKYESFDYSFISKKKKQAALDGIPVDLGEVSDNLINYALIVFESVHQNILEIETKDDDDDW